VSEEEEGEGRKVGASVLVFFPREGGVYFVFKKMRGGQGLRLLC